MTMQTQSDALLGPTYVGPKARPSKNLFPKSVPSDRPEGQGEPCRTPIRQVIAWSWPRGARFVTQNITYSRAGYQMDLRWSDTVTYGAAPLWYCSKTQYHTYHTPIRSCTITCENLLHNFLNFWVSECFLVHKGRKPFLDHYTDPLKSNGPESSAKTQWETVCISDTWEENVAVHELSSIKGPLKLRQRYIRKNPQISASNILTLGPKIS